MIFRIVFKKTAYLFEAEYKIGGNNNLRIHESLDYMTPVEYRALNTMKLGKAS